MIDFSKIEKDPLFPNKDYYPFYYKGFRVEQHPSIFDALDFFELTFPSNTASPPRNIIEIGSRNCGFTKVLDDHPISSNANIYTFDIQEHEISEGLSSKVKRFVKDCFEAEDFIRDLIQQEGKSIVFCDGGDKNREFEVFARFLKRFDVILVHDYAPDEEIWRKEYFGKRWDWHESYDRRIKPAMEENNLKDLCQEAFEKAIWKCCIKN